jgi:GT2 family glycosyltransferase
VKKPPAAFSPPADPLPGAVRAGTGGAGSRPTIGVGIATQDRWDELAGTLSRLEENGLHRCDEVLVIDDGSAQPLPAAFRTRFPWVRFERSRQRLGYIAQRNRIARELTTALYLSLDDDSFIEQGDLATAAQWLEQRNDAVALCFSIVLYDEEAVVPAAAPSPVRFYIGCAHLVKREFFLALGGYREELEHLCEEVQFCLAAVRRNLDIWHYPQVLVRHRPSHIGRNQPRAQRLLTRNDLYCAALYYPWPYFILSVLNCLPRQFMRAEHRRYWRSVLAGFGEALVRLPRLWSARTPLSFAQMRRWRQAAHPLDVVMSRPASVFVATATAKPR